MPYLIFLLTSLVAVLVGGCQSTSATHSLQPAHAGRMPVAVQAHVPRELCKTTLPTYVIEPPDILLVTAMHLAPRSPYQLRILDTLDIQVDGALLEAPISGLYPIQLGGAVNLGVLYGSVKVAGLTVEQAGRAIEQHLRNTLRNVRVSVSLADIGARQQIAGQHLVAPDGTVTLGVYGSVRVAGLTLAQAKMAIEDHLAQSLHMPEVALDVYSYNSKVYYVVTEGAGLGDGVYRFPVTGNETVLDAIAQINGLEQVSSKKIWIARPTGNAGNVQILPVDWEGVTAQACTSSNYQVFPGDRVFIAEDKWVAFDTAVGKITAPFERIMGFTLLGASTATRLSGKVLEGGGNRNSTF